MKVFGIGLSKTGTTSLAEALRVLGFATVDSPHDSQSREEILAMLAANGGSGAGRLSVLDRFDAATDLPIAANYRALDRGYPGSRFVLTVREKGQWLASCERWWPERIMPFYDHPENWFTQYLEALCSAVFGTTDYDADLFSAAYDSHLEGVLEHFRSRSDELLVLDVSSDDAWAQLSEFLDRPAPRDTPFPHANAFPR